MTEIFLKVRHLRFLQERKDLHGVGQRRRMGQVSLINLGCGCGTAVKHIPSNFLEVMGSNHIEFWPCFFFFYVFFLLSFAIGVSSLLSARRRWS